MPHSEVNWVAVLVVSIVGFLLGGVWYSVFFGRLWRRLSGVQPDQFHFGAALAYGIGFVCTFVMAYVMARLVDFVYREPDQKTLLNGMLLGLMVWTGFVATTGLSNDLFGRKPLLRWLIESLHALVVLVVMGATLALWQ
jgi:F0F1-type ATP synthase membrane subunit c/vacuolar-type H+-ATPase subunit K